MRPNIFEISTKELTQDGFVTWLLQWADPSNEQFDKELFKCGTDFVKLLLKKQIKNVINISKVEAGRQWENIDIWADINEKYFVIIEDKTFTGEHSKQLERYKKISEKWCKDNKRELICIYLKTGTESKSSQNIVLEKGFSIVDRTELSHFLNNYKINNNIYIDFIEKMNTLEKAEQEFETKKIKDWDWNSWVGFYHYLDTKFDIANWRYVSNPAGGFLGIWWHFLEWKKYNVYLQIEQGNLCFKIGEVYKDHRNIRTKWHNILMEKAKEMNRTEIKKPVRFGNGTYMTVGVVERKDWLGNDEDILDKEKIIKKLKEYEKILDKCLL